MESRVNKVYFLIPLLYIAVIFVLLLLQFSGGKLFRANAGQILLRGNFAMGSGNSGSTITDLSVEFQGLRFPFTPDRGLVVDTRDGRESELRATGYNKLDNGFEILFEHGAKLTFTPSGPNNAGMEIIPAMPDSLGPVSSLTLPFGLNDASISKPDKNIPVFSVRYGSHDYLLTLPARSNITSGKDQLIVAGSSEKLNIRYMLAPPSTKDFFTLWFESQDMKVSEAEYTGAIQNYVNVAYSAWVDKRYNPTTGTWSSRDGTQSFSESILAASLAEAWRRDDYTRVFTEMRTAADKHPSGLTYLSSVYLGNLIEMNQKLQSSDQQESARLASLVSGENRDAFRSPHALKFAADRGGSGLLQNLLQFAGHVDLNGVDVVTALGMLQNALEADQISPDAASSLSRFFELISSTLVPNIVKTDQGFFLQVRPGRIELYYSVLGGRLLIQAGQKQNDEKLLLMGRSLVLSALDFADDQGFLPQILFFDNSTIKESQGTIAPEDIYALISSNPFYPREVSFYKAAGPGAWMWTIMGIVDTNFTVQEWRINLNYQPGRTQYILIEGVPDFRQMFLFGFDGPWRADPSFESYSKGRYYIPATESLLIKYLDDTGNHSIIIDF